ncbi:hypothetical protein B7486_67500, partial [cyanobacterium TDX16]
MELAARWFAAEAALGRRPNPHGAAGTRRLNGSKQREASSAVQDEEEGVGSGPTRPTRGARQGLVGPEPPGGAPSPELLAVGRGRRTPATGSRDDCSGGPLRTSVVVRLRMHGRTCRVHEGSPPTFSSCTALLARRRFEPFARLVPAAPCESSL